VRNTFPWGENPPTIVEGVIVKELRKTDPPDGETVATPLATEPLKVAVTVTEIDVLTFPATTEMLPLIFPADMERLEGTGNAELLVIERLTCAPLAGAGPFNVTVTVADDPPVIVDGLIATLVKVAVDVAKLKTADQFPY
jgi:hypothetical protein